MARTDLLALSHDDLMAMTNRGTVKRAQREIDSGDFTFEVSESAKRIVLTWSDDVICTFPSDKTVYDAKCSSGSLGISRYVIRSVLAYQSLFDDVGEQQSQITAKANQGSAAGEQTTPLAVWNPGDISDEQLQKQFGKATFNRAKKQFDNGVLVELTLGEKPVARFLHESCTIRFPVPNDLRYASADCAESKLNFWSMMAVWAFRKLPKDRVAGLVSIQRSELSIPEAEIKALEQLILELICDGLSGLPVSWEQRVGRVEKKLRASGLIWPAELANELSHSQQLYLEHNARFDPVELARLIGEVIARLRVIRNPDSLVPQSLVRGTKSDRQTEIKSSRYFGVGLGVEVGRSSVGFKAYMQDVDTGSVVAVERNFNDPPPDSRQEKRSFVDLSETVLKRGVSLGQLAISQVLVGAGKRTSGNILVLPRGQSKFSANPHTFDWDQLKPPFAVENFDQLRQRLEALPPPFLRPRRCTEDLFVLSVRAIQDTEFDVVNQQLQGTVLDSLDNTASLIHPYHSRGMEGFNETLSNCQQQGENLRFVCGRVRLSGSTVQVFPVSLLFESKGERQLIQVWLKNPDCQLVAEGVEADLTPTLSSLQEFQSLFGKVLSELLVVGVTKTSLMELEELLSFARSLGCLRIASQIEEVHRELNSRKDRLNWNSKTAARQVAQLCMLFVVSA